MKPSDYPPNDPNDWRQWLDGLARGWHGLVGENTHRAQAIIDHIDSLEDEILAKHDDLWHQSDRRKYWRAQYEEACRRADVLADIIRDIAESGCECAEAATCGICGHPLSDCSGGEHS